MDFRKRTVYLHGQALIERRLNDDLSFSKREVIVINQMVLLSLNPTAESLPLTVLTAVYGSIVRNAASHTIQNIKSVSTMLLRVTIGKT